VVTIFRTAQLAIRNDFSRSGIQERINAIHVKLVDPAEIAKNLHVDNYRRYVTVPAYYDPNAHTVYLNKPVLSEEPEPTIRFVCYHELLHGASTHQDYTDGNAHIYQSGLKIERYENGRYMCQNRLLNEGCIQFLTKQHNPVPINGYAYQYETDLVAHMAKKIGIKLITNALFHHGYQDLIEAFQSQYGPGSFYRFSRLIEKRKYDEASTLIKT